MSEPNEDPRIQAAMARHARLREQHAAQWQAELDRSREVEERLTAELVAARRIRRPVVEAPLAPVVPHPSAKRPNLLRDLPAVYGECTFDSWNASVGIGCDELRTWRGVPAQVLIYGPQGVGKSHLGAAVFRSWCESGSWWMKHGERPRWITADGYVQRLKRDMSTDSGDTVERFGKAALLVLDDLGRERATEWSTSEIASLLMARWGEKRPTLVTTNLTPDQLTAWEGRVASRFVGRESLVLELVGLADYRQGGAA